MVKKAKAATMTESIKKAKEQIAEAKLTGDVGAEWMRLPAPGLRDRMTGLSRTTLNEVIERGEVQAVTIRAPGAGRGIRLINIASVRAWLARLSEEQMNP